MRCFVLLLLLSLVAASGCGQSREQQLVTATADLKAEEADLVAATEARDNAETEAVKAMAVQIKRRSTNLRPGDDDAVDSYKRAYAGADSGVRQQKRRVEQAQRRVEALLSQ
jgi:hypothetical protein